MSAPVHFDIEEARRASFEALDNAKVRAAAGNEPAAIIEVMTRLLEAAVAIRLEYLRLFNDGLDHQIIRASIGAVIGQMLGEAIANAPAPEMQELILINFFNGFNRRVDRGEGEINIHARTGGHA